MRQLKYGIFLLISLLFITVEVNANTGICTGKDMDPYGYCNITPVKIDGSAIPEQLIKFTDGTSAIINSYSGFVIDRNQMMFCIDANHNAPGDQLYGLARPFDVTSSAYDRSIAKVYGAYINEVIWLMNQGNSKEAAYNRYLQMINVVMRAITIKYDYYMQGGPFINNLLAYKNVVKQLEGSKPTGKKLQEDATYYPILKKWYTEAMSGAQPVQIKLDFNSKNEDITTEYIGNNFTQTIPVTVTGLSMFTDPKYENTNPTFKIKSVKCENEKLTCSLESTTPVNTDLIPSISDDEYEFKVIVKGDKTNFLDETSTKVIIEYEKYHILDIDNLAVLRYSNTNQTRQRMIVLMPDTPQTASVKINISMPSMCEAEVTGGVQKYLYGGTPMSELNYLKTGCCNVDYDYLKNEEAKEYYLDNCSTGDIIHLVNVCNNETNEMSHSYVYQKEINKIMDQVNGAEDMYIKGSYSLGTLKNTLSNYDNNIDRVYSEDGISPRNDYCKMYTSEKQDIYYPGTAESTGGQFFVFREIGTNKFLQPKVNGEIYANFHTDVNRWLDDYKKAIEKEKEAYTSWQEAAALENAIGKLTSCYSSGDCGCCSDKCTGSCKTRYSGSNTAYADAGTYFKADGTDLKTVRARQSCGCGSSSRTSKPSPSASQRRNTYNKAKADRIKLEDFKEECEAKTNIKDDWKYQLSPELTFYYKQRINAESEDAPNPAELLTESVPMEISKEKVKYWEGISQNPIEKSYFGKPEKIIIDETYGDAKGDRIIEFPYDKTKDYQIGYTQELFYKPSVYYYSLVPSGKYIKSQEKKEGKSVLDVGYVFNIDITNYEGFYETWFEIENIGHLMKDPEDKPKLKSNIQKSVDDYIDDNKDKYLDHEDKVNTQLFASKCFYHNKEVLYKRDCLDCTDPSFEAQFFYRTISLNNVNPNDRVNTNWTSTKGDLAKKSVQSLGDQIYNDNTREYLEYSFILDPNDMKDIKDYNNKNKYSDFQLECENGKECESDFLTLWAKNSNTEELLNDTRNNKWKYFINGAWTSGNISDLMGGYPPETKNLTDWP
ncbi:MAG: hypothetical protein PHH51_01245 [Bacilli bacterium]|nr:hypothetical protein [Bacilli bacterium]